MLGETHLNFSCRYELTLDSFRPLDENGIRFRPEVLSTAVSLFQIPDTACLCATQESDPVMRASHKGHIRVCSTDGIHSVKVVYGCRAQRTGCGMFSKLSNL